MVKRKTSSLENRFNLNRHKKRKGAKDIAQSFDNVDHITLKNTLIDGEVVENFQSYMIKDLTQHLKHLRMGFHNQPELLFYHAQLIVLIRREADVKNNFARFKHLWECEAGFLLEHLNMRWLVSAVDTFIDCEKDDAERAIYLNIITLINTIKLYETERFLLGIETCDENTYDSVRFDSTQKNCFPLFDELPSFRIGVDDTLRNMRWRMDDISQPYPLAQYILTAIFDRVNERGSAYTRFKNRHKKMCNAWWSE